MPTPKSLWGIRGDECQCGRRATVRHCPDCGSTIYYAPRRLEIREKPGPNGDPIPFLVQTFHCRRCPSVFTDADREFCQASPIGEALTRLRIQNIHNAKRSGESLTPTEEKIAKSVSDLLDDNQQAAVAGVDSDEAAYREFRIIESQLMQMYNEEAFKYKQEGKEHPETVDEFVSKMMTMHGIKRVEKPSASVDKSTKGEK